MLQILFLFILFSTFYVLEKNVAGISLPRRYLGRISGFLLSIFAYGLFHTQSTIIFLGNNLYFYILQSVIFLVLFLVLSLISVKLYRAYFFSTLNKLLKYYAISLGVTMILSFFWLGYHLLVGTLTNEAVSRFDEVELPDFLIERIESENIVSGRVSRCNDTFGIYYLSYGTGFTSYLEIYTLSGKLLTRDYSGDAGAGTFRIFDWPSVITDDCEIVWQRSF